MLTLVYYAAEGALHTFFEGFVLINAHYTQQGSAISQLGHNWAHLRGGYGGSLWVILLGLVALPVLAAVAVPTAWRTREAGPVTLVATGAASVAGVGWACIAFNGWPDLFELLPFAALGVGGLVAAVLRRLDVRAATAVAVTLAVVGTAFATVTSLTTKGSGLVRQRASVAAILHAGPRGATMLSLEAPEAMAIAHRRNPTSIQMFTNGFAQYVDDTWPGGLKGYARWIEEQAPTYIVVAPDPPAAVADAAPPPRLPTRRHGAGLRVVGTTRLGACAGAASDPPRKSKGHVHMTDRRVEAADADRAMDRTAYLYSVVIPVYNSEAIVGETVRRVIEVFAGAGLRWEIILVNDGSPDRSWSVISELARTTPHVVALNLLKNYGQHHANLAGFMESRGDYVITMDDDLQNPPDQALLLIDEAMKGHDVVFGKFAAQAGREPPAARQQADQHDQPAGLRAARRPRRVQLPDPAPRRRRPDLRVAHGAPLRHRPGAPVLEQPRQRVGPP